MTTERFDKAAATWDAKPRRVLLSEAITNAIADVLPLSKEMTGLEYGCGTGLVTFGVAASVGRMYGLDSSAGMIKVFAEKCTDLGIVNVTPFQGDLPEFTGPPLDLIIISMTLHHIDQHLDLVQNCFNALKPSGFLAIADLKTEDGSFHEDHTGIFHFGFDPDVLCKEIEDCGFASAKAQEIHVLERHGAQYPVFLLTAVK